MRSSSDNGSSWDNVTSGTTRHLYETAFGNDTFISVGQRGTIRQSQDNGSTWNSGTWSESSNLNGVAHGNNTFVALGTRFIRSTDNGSNWNTISTTSLVDVAW